MQDSWSGPSLLRWERPPACRRIWLGINVHLCCCLVHWRLRFAARQQKLCLILSSHIFPHLGGFPAAPLSSQTFHSHCQIQPSNSCDPFARGPAPSPLSSPNLHSLLSYMWQRPFCFYCKIVPWLHLLCSFPHWHPSLYVLLLSSTLLIIYHPMRRKTGRRQPPHYITQLAVKRWLPSKNEFKAPLKEQTVAWFLSSVKAALEGPVWEAFFTGLITS